MYKCKLARKIPKNIKMSSPKQSKPFTPHTVLEATTDQQILSCYPVVKSLILNLTSPEQYLQEVREIQKQNYHVLFIQDTLEDEAELRTVSCLGYRIMHNFCYRKELLINELMTLPGAMKKGYGGALVDKAIEIAKKEDCQVVSLGTLYNRTDAHRLYANKGFCTTMHHFCKDLKPKQ